MERGLDRGWKAQDVRQLFRLLDWILALPVELEGQFRGELHRFEEERHRPYVTSVERLAKEEGRQAGRQKGKEEGLRKGKEEGLREGLIKGITAALKCKFGSAGLELLPRVRTLKSVAKLEALTEAIPSASTVEEVRKRLR